jgi:MCP family monocarboxylic acid transporter-like MFS transporter 10
MLSLSKPHQYYQIFLSQGVGMGLGVGFTFVPTLSNLAHHFYDRKALATGIALSGSSTGALIFPISEFLVVLPTLN